jgi:type II secretory pathway component GspD/PulD (secretin)
MAQRKMIMRLRLLTIFIFFILAFAANVKAEELSLQFSEVPVLKFAEATYKDILKKDYVLTPSALAVTEKITLNVKTDREKLPLVIKDVLLSAGVSVYDRDGVIWIDRAKMFDVQEQTTTEEKKEEGKTDVTLLVDKSQSSRTIETQEVFLYRPKFRRLDDLQKLLTNLVKTSIADDSLVVHGDTSKIAVSRILLKEFDTKRDELLAKVTVVEYTSDSDDGAGFFGALNILGQKLNLSVGERGVLGSVVSFKNTTIEAVLSVISSDSRYNIVTSSRLRIGSGKTGRLSVGQEVPTLGKNDYDRNGNPVQSIFYREAGLIVDLKPVIISDELITSDIQHEVSNFAVTKTSSIDSPTITKRSFSTSFSSDFGEIVFLGGLNEEKNNEANSGLFGLRLSRQSINSNTVMFLVLEYERI